MNCSIIFFLNLLTGSSCEEFRHGKTVLAAVPILVYNRGVGYKTLYRKYRSQTFSEVIGQEHVIRVLRGALVRGRIAHAYLFSGPRGTGKTSIARIFAKALNCSESKAGEPCGKCHVCTSIAEGRSPDVIEMDAASNRGVEHIEELRRGVQFVPQELKYKVYIIDEVHMISTHGFNALLKTLGEPPAHAIFVLATTEPHKLPITILSRCLRFEFHRIPFRKLAGHLSSLAEMENHKIRDDAAILLAELSEGSARDAISLLDQLIIAGEDEITPSLVRELFGLTHPAAITDLVRSLLSGNLEKLLQSFHDFITEGRDPEHFLKLLYGKLRDGYLRTGEDDELLLMLEETPRSKLLRAIESVWESLVLLSRSNHPVNLIELTLFKLAGVFATGSHRLDVEDDSDFDAEIAPASEPPEIAKKSSDSIAEPAATGGASETAPETEDAPAEQSSDSKGDAFNPKSFINRFKQTRTNPFAEGGEEPQTPPAAEKPEKKTVDNAGVIDEPSAGFESSQQEYSESEAASPEWGGIENVPQDFPPTFYDAEISTADVEPRTSSGSKKAAAKRPVLKRKLPGGIEEFPEAKWSDVLKRLEDNYLTTYCLVREESGVIPVILKPGILYLAFPADSLYLRSFAKEGRHIRAIEASVEETMESKWQIVFDPSEAPDPGVSDEDYAELRAAQLEMLFGANDKDSGANNAGGE